MGDIIIDKLLHGFPVGSIMMSTKRELPSVEESVGKGTWELLDQTTLGGKTVYIFERIA